MSDPQPCESCGRYDLAHDPAATQALLSAIRAEAQDRLLTVEAWMRLASSDDRVAAVRFLDGITDRTPLTMTAYRAVRTLLASVAADIAQTAIDPDSPMTPAGIVPMPDRRLTEEPAEPEGTSPDELRKVLGGVFEA